MKEKTNRSIGVLFTSFFGYLPYFSFLIILIKYFRRIKISKRLLLFSILISSLLFVSFLFTLNNNILRVFILVILNVALFGIMSTANNDVLKLHNLADWLFGFHTIVIFLSILSPALNTFLTNSDENVSRIGGLIGYDYMAFFYGTYLYSEYLCLGRKIDLKYVFKLLLSTVFVLISGRFGVLILFYLFSYLFFDKISWKKIFGIISIVILTMIFLSSQLKFILDSSLGFISYLKDNDSSALYELSSQESDNSYYSASPITWLNMFLRPFVQISSYWLPSFDPVIVDPGPSFIILNFGLILAFLLYYYFHMFFKINKNISWPLFIIFLLSDLKYHGIFVPACMFWVYLNIYKIRGFNNV